jgi:hypothetical protein
MEELSAGEQAGAIQTLLLDAAREMHLEIEFANEERKTVSSVIGPVLTRRAPSRDKRIRCDAEQ